MLVTSFDFVQQSLFARFGVLELEVASRLSPDNRQRECDKKMDIVITSGGTLLLWYFTFQY